MVNKILLNMFCALFFFSSGVFAATPRFSEYKVESIYKGRNSPLVKVDSAGVYWDDLRRMAVEKPVNFAGHYILFTGDCGGTSVCGEVIDAETGKVVRSLPNAYQAYDEETEEGFDIEYNVNSKLIVIMGVAQDGEVGANNEKVSRVYRTRYYEFDGGDFNFIFSEAR